VNSIITIKTAKQLSRQVTTKFMLWLKGIEKAPCEVFSENFYKIYPQVNEKNYSIFFLKASIMRGRTLDGKLQQPGL